MKNILLPALLFYSLSGRGQIIADPALTQISAISLGSLPLDVTNLSMDSIIKLKVPIYNKNLINGLPSGTCKIKIGLGSKIELVAGFNLTIINTNAYFNWTATVTGGQQQITGDLIAPLPANFSDTAVFIVQGKIAGNSTITTNFLVTNHNTVINLSDENPANNNSFLAYTIIPTQIIPVTFTKVQAINEACNIRVNFDAENEINVDRFEVEISKDGINFQKAGQLSANGRIHYNISIAITDNLKAAQLFVRIKSLDKDDKFKYSETRKVSGVCEDTKGTLLLFPNPANAETNKLSIKMNNGMFNGKYNLSLIDISGKTLSKINQLLLNVTQFTYEIKSFPAGQYILNISNKENGQTESVKWIKY